MDRATATDADRQRVFNALYDAHVRSVLAYAIRRLPTMADAETDERDSTFDSALNGSTLVRRRPTKVRDTPLRRSLGCGRTTASCCASSLGRT
jgi:hypothetical protein